MDYSFKINAQHDLNYQFSSGLQVNRIPSKNEHSEGKLRTLFDLELCNLKRAYGVSLEDHESASSFKDDLGKNEDFILKSVNDDDLEKSGDEDSQEIDWADGHHPLEFCECQIEDENDLNSSTNSENEYKCGNCFFFGTKKQLQSHNEDNHPQLCMKAHWCSHCHLNFESEISFQMHETQQHVHPCTYCKKNFKKQRFLLAHLPVHLKEKCFKCPTCEKEFPSQRYLVRHMERHKQMPEMLKEVEKVSFKCTLCQKIFIKRESLAKHMRIHCRESLKCSQCEFSCEKKVILKMHVLTHGGNRKYKCAQCDFSFKQIGHLKRHIARFNH